MKKTIVVLILFSLFLIALFQIQAVRNNLASLIMFKEDFSFSEKQTIDEKTDLVEEIKDPLIEADFPNKVRINQEFKVLIQGFNLKPVFYDVKITVEKDKTISQTFFKDNWKSSHFYILKEFLGPSFSKELKLKITNPDFSGKADLIVRLRENGKTSYLELIKEIEIEKEEKEEEKQTCQKNSIDINNAFLQELQELTGIGPVYAQRIIDNRPFYSIYELTKVKGIGEITLQKIIDQGCAYVENDIGLLEQEHDFLIEEEQVSCSININTASSQELEEIISIGPVLAQRIIEARPFYSIYELTKIVGIGDKTLQKIIDQGCAYVENDIGPQNFVFSTSVSKVCKKDSIEINTASLKELELLTGIGPTYAQRITENRIYFSLYELTKVSGIGDKTLQKIIDQGCAYINENFLPLSEDEEKIYFQIIPNHLYFKAEYGENPTAQSLYVSNLKDEVYTSSLFNGIYFSDLNYASKLTDDIYASALINGVQYSIQLNQNEFEISLNTLNKEPGVYEVNLSFSYKEQVENVSIFLEIVENLLENEFFEEWENEIPKNWEWKNTLTRIGKSNDNPFYGNYNLILKPISSHNILSQAIPGERDVIYYGEVWAKSINKVKIRLGIRIDGNNRYGDYVELENNGWTKITFSRQSKEGKDDGFIISVQESENKDRSEIIIGATWFGLSEPPENWPLN
ncbi:MAG: helix-hairpin-helix domain-containing protein [Candidatus Pacebacteria bacterium]|nr:helix-hairpin-helix domain-containing protein [Candidatus Paceibacterota bacterium]